MAFWLWLMLAVLVVLVIIVIAMLSRIRIRIRYSRSGPLDHLVVAIEALFGLFHYQIVIPSILLRGWTVIWQEQRKGGFTGDTGLKLKQRNLMKAKSGRMVKVYRRIIRPRPAFRRIMLDTLKKVECTRWRLDWRFGTGDAALTGVAAGLLWAVTGCAAGVASRLVTLTTAPQTRMEPNFCGREFAVVWESDYQLRMGTAFWTTLKLGSQAIEMGKSLRYWTQLLQGPKQA